MRRALIFILVFLALAALVGGFAYFQFVMKPQMIQQAMQGQSAPPTEVPVEAAQSESWRPGLPAIGTFEAIQGIRLAPETAGLVDAIEFDSGREVEEGDLLLELDTNVERAQLKAAEAQLTQSQADLGRQQELVQRGNTPRSSFDAAVAQRDSNAAEVERIRALIAQKVILAPFPGRLGIRQVDVGQFVSAGDTLVTLQQLDPIYVDFPIPEQSIEQVAIGLEVQIAVDAFPETEFAGKVAFIDARVDQETRNLLVRAQVANPDKRLLPGMFANVNVLQASSEEVVTVPRTAISYSLYGDSLYVVTQPEGGEPAGPGSVVDIERRFVKTGATRGERVAVTEGIKSGEQVLTGGQNKVYPGQKVKISDKPALQAPDQTPKL
ncbi:MAG: efflux RND transporter periplasmic adaptor subunit [Tistlia sp.]|uniref:efflux RND transporter periplasmic adaptor subunit n=1 Tax=Tistlia sp. TaxID=3057121 RepID=UPI0034A2718C